MENGITLNLSLPPHPTTTMQDQQHPTLDYGEPWQNENGDFEIYPRTGGEAVAYAEGTKTRDRIIACVNACAGISNLDGIAVMRKALWDMSTGSIPSGEVRALATYALNVLRGDSQATVAAALGWQPIETAPKNSHAILAMLTDSDLAHTIRWRVDGWEIAWDSSPLGPHDQPTHWMPLPTPPQA